MCPEAEMMNSGTAGHAEYMQNVWMGSRKRRFLHSIINGVTIVLNQTIDIYANPV